MNTAVMDMTVHLRLTCLAQAAIFGMQRGQGLKIYVAVHTEEWMDQLATAIDKVVKAGLSSILLLVPGFT